MHEANVLVAWRAISDRFSDHGNHLSAEVLKYFHPNPDLLRHVSPIEWKNVILYGEIKIDPAKLKMREP